MQNKPPLPLVLALLAVAAVGLLILFQGWHTVSRLAGPEVGHQCFELHRELLPLGTQYEGYRASGERLTVRIMTGTELKELQCVLGPDGALDVERSEKLRSTLN